MEILAAAFLLVVVGGFVTGAIIAAVLEALESRIPKAHSRCGRVLSDSLFLPLSGWYNIILPRIGECGFSRFK